jgi:hypothetical protein
MLTKRQVAKLLCGMVVDMTEAEAGKEVTHAGLHFRVIERDGKHPVVTRDHKLDRVNVRITAGKVTSAEVG